MKLHIRHLTMLLSCLLVIVVTAQVIQFVSMSAKISDLSKANYQLLKQRESDAALDTARRLEQAVEGSIERGEMEKFTELLKDQHKVGALQAFYLYGYDGSVTHSSDDKFLGRKIPGEVRDELMTTGTTVMRTPEGAIEIFEPQPVTGDCIRCHTEWTVNDNGGVIYMKFSTDSLLESVKQSGVIITDLNHASFFISLVSVCVTLAVLLATLFIARMIRKRIREISDDLVSGSALVSSGSGMITQSSKLLATGATQQAESLEMTSDAIREMTVKIQKSAENSDTASRMMKDTNRIVDLANDSMNRLMTSMTEISKASEEASNIVRTIDEIAFQTNLLALNAAVEAARAGESGVGFAVVADEVRNLSVRAAEAAKNTEAMIQATIDKIEIGSGFVASASDALVKVVKSTDDVGELIDEISVSSSSQADGIAQVSTTLIQMDTVTRENAESAEKFFNASGEMDQQALKMTQCVQGLVAIVDRKNKTIEPSSGYHEVGRLPKPVSG